MVHSVKHFEVGDAHNAYPSILQYVLQFGKSISSRGGDVVEIEDMSVCFTNPCKTETPLRERSAPLIGYIEGAQLVGSFEANDLMKRAFPKYFNFSDGYGNYGSRSGINGQLEYVFEELRRDPNTRRAIVTLWNPLYDVPATHTDHPCTVTIMFRVRHGFLNMTVAMRSQDMWLGHPYDVIQFALLQQTFATALELQCGTFTHHMASCHIYVRDVPAINYFLDSSELEIGTAYTSPISILPLSEPGWSYNEIALEARQALLLESSGQPKTKCGMKIAGSVANRLIDLGEPIFAAPSNKSDVDDE